MSAGEVAAAVSAPTSDLSSPPPAFDRAESAQIDRLVRDVCKREIVLLGEDANHGGARTLEVKTEILRRLIARCGFRAVVFESQFYDLLDYEHARVAGAADAEWLADAIGALWARARESRPLIASLHREAAAGRVRIAGIDPQVGGVMGRYSKRELGQALAAALHGQRRIDCGSELDRHNAWRYDEAAPFDQAARVRLRGCIDEIRETLTRQDAGARPAGEALAMAASYARYLDMALAGDGRMRELGMYENLLWHRARWPRGTRVVVWCASVHAAKNLDGLAGDLRPMGADLREVFGARMAVIGFSAQVGAFGNPGAAGAPNPLAPAPEGTLEAIAFETDEVAADAGGLRYLDSRRLKALGTIAARAIDYRRLHAAPWTSVFDGMMVLREERPITPIR